MLRRMRRQSKMVQGGGGSDDMHSSTKQASVLWYVVVNIRKDAKVEMDQEEKSVIQSVVNAFNIKSFIHKFSTRFLSSRP